MQTKTNNQEVYKITGFADIVESPVFYLVLVLTFILGVSSIFGFLQNPRKLKSVVDVIQRKVAVYKVRNSRNRYSRIEIKDNKYSILYQSSSASQNTVKNYPSDKETNRNRYSILSKNIPLKTFMHSGIGSVSYDYDITSKRFWSNLQLDILDMNTNPRSAGSQFLGVPLDKVITLEEGDSKYSMANGLKKGQVSL